MKERSNEKRSHTYISRSKRAYTHTRTRYACIGATWINSPPHLRHPLATLVKFSVASACLPLPPRTHLIATEHANSSSLLRFARCFYNNFIFVWKSLLAFLFFVDSRIPFFIALLLYARQRRRRIYFMVYDAGGGGRGR